MMDPRSCPNCNSIDTTVQHTDWSVDHVERVRTCRRCPTEFVVSYGDPHLEQSHTLTNEGATSADNEDDEDDDHA